MFADDSSLEHTFRSKYTIQKGKRKYDRLTINLKAAEMMICLYVIIKKQKLEPNFAASYQIEHLIKILNTYTQIHFPLQYSFKAREYEILSL